MRVARWVVVGASPIGDAAKLIGAREGGKGDVGGMVRKMRRGFRRPPSVGIEWNGTDLEDADHLDLGFRSEIANRHKTLDICLAVLIQLQ